MLISIYIDFLLFYFTQVPTLKWAKEQNKNWRLFPMRERYTKVIVMSAGGHLVWRLNWFSYCHSDWLHSKLQNRFFPRHQFFSFVFKISSLKFKKELKLLFKAQLHFSFVRVFFCYYHFRLRYTKLQLSLINVTSRTFQMHDVTVVESRKLRSCTFDVRDDNVWKDLKNTKRKMTMKIIRDKISGFFFFQIKCIINQ